MTYPATIRTSLITSFALLLCTSIACAQEDVTSSVTNGFIENGSASTNESESLATTTDETSADKSVSKPETATEPSGTEEARPGERVTNPDHLILNPDTTLGGVEIRGTKVTDYGYLGPGDMRTHLWNGHSKELIENGITENKLMAMKVDEVQQWHNHFHGAEGSPDDPDHDHDDGEDTNAQQLATDYVDETIIEGTIIYEDSPYDNSEYSQSFNVQPEIIYGEGVIIDGSSSYGFETPMESWPTDR